jgi:multiple sugar transport system substrate-binding protein
VLADDLKKAGITVKYEPIDGDFAQIITNALSAGTAPDIFYVDTFWAYPLFKSGKVEPVSKANQATLDEIIPSLNEAFEYEGKSMGIAKDFNTLALQYNMDIFDDAGVAYPNATDDWYSLRDKLVTVQSKLADVSGVCVVPDYARFAAFALSSGWKPFNAMGHTVLNNQFKDAFSFYTSLPDVGAGVVAADVGQGWTGGCFGEELAAIAIEGAWISGYLRDQAPNLQYGVTSMPLGPKTKQPGNLIFTVSWSIAKDSTVKESAHKVVELLTSEKAQQWVLESGLALPSRAALANNDYLQGDSIDQQVGRVVFEGASLGNVQAFSFGEHGGAWKEIMDEALSSVLLKEKSVDEALQDAQKRFDTLTH